eukprot:SAG25_NODE_118_length_14760_cov_873.663666_13_plen_112_part_00
MFCSPGSRLVFQSVYPHVMPGLPRERRGGSRQAGAAGCDAAGCALVVAVAHGQSCLRYGYVCTHCVFVVCYHVCPFGPFQHPSAIDGCCGWALFLAAEARGGAAGAGTGAY